MNIQNPKANFAGATNSCRAGRHLGARGLFLLAVSSSLMLSPVLAHEQAADIPRVAVGEVLQAQVQLVVGGQSIKNNSKETLSVVGSSLQLQAQGKTVSVDASSFFDISTDKDSRQDITGAAHLAAEAIS